MMKIIAGIKKSDVDLQKLEQLENIIRNNLNDYTKMSHMIAGKIQECIEELNEIERFKNEED